MTGPELLDRQQQLSALDRVALPDLHRSDCTAHPGRDCGFHLHGLDGHQSLVLFHLVAHFDIDLADGAGDGCSHLAPCPRGLP